MVGWSTNGQPAGCLPHEVCVQVQCMRASHVAATRRTSVCSHLKTLSSSVIMSSLRFHQCFPRVMFRWQQRAPIMNLTRGVFVAGIASVMALSLSACNNNSGRDQAAANDSPRAAQNAATATSVAANAATQLGSPAASRTSAAPAPAATASRPESASSLTTPASNNNPPAGNAAMHAISAAATHVKHAGHNTRPAANERKKAASGNGSRIKTGLVGH